MNLEACVHTYLCSGITSLLTPLEKLAMLLIKSIIITNSEKFAKFMNYIIVNVMKIICICLRCKSLVISLRRKPLVINLRCKTPKRNNSCMLLVFSLCDATIIIMCINTIKEKQNKRKKKIYL